MITLTSHMIYHFTLKVESSSYAKFAWLCSIRFMASVLWACVLCLDFWLRKLKQALPKEVAPQDTSTRHIYLQTGFLHKTNILYDITIKYFIFQFCGIMVSFTKVTVTRLFVWIMSKNPTYELAWVSTW